MIDPWVWGHGESVGVHVNGPRLPQAMPCVLTYANPADKPLRSICQASFQAARTRCSQNKSQQGFDLCMLLEWQAFLAGAENALATMVQPKANVADTLLQNMKKPILGPASKLTPATPHLKSGALAGGGSSPALGLALVALAGLGCFAGAAALGGLR